VTETELLINITNYNVICAWHTAVYKRFESWK